MSMIVHVCSLTDQYKSLLLPFPPTSMLYVLVGAHSLRHKQVLQSDESVKAVGLSSRKRKA
jgi:hypothetical protein